MLIFVPFDFRIQTLYTYIFKNWIYFYYSVTGIFSQTSIYTFASLPHWKARVFFFFLTIVFVPGFVIKQWYRKHAGHTHASLWVPRSFPSDSLWKVELFNQKGMYILNFNKFCQIIFWKVVEIYNPTHRGEGKNPFPQTFPQSRAVKSKLWKSFPNY